MGCSRPKSPPSGTVRLLAMVPWRLENSRRTPKGIWRCWKKQSQLDCPCLGNSELFPEWRIETGCKYWLKNIYSKQGMAGYLEFLAAVPFLGALTVSICSGEELLPSPLSRGKDLMCCWARGLHRVFSSLSNPVIPWVWMEGSQGHCFLVYIQ